MQFLCLNLWLGELCTDDDANDDTNDDGNDDVGKSIHTPFYPLMLHSFEFCKMMEKLFKVELVLLLDYGAIKQKKKKKKKKKKIQTILHILMVFCKFLVHVKYLLCGVLIRDPIHMHRPETNQFGKSSNKEAVGLRAQLSM